MLRHCLPTTAAAATMPATTAVIATSASAPVATASASVVNSTAAKRSRPVAQPVTAALVPEALLTWKTLSALSGMSLTTRRRHKAADPRFPSLVHVGGSARFVASDALAWLASHRPATRSD
jgi:predicted DNA-binding transcriptional regulator AlpA